VSNQGPHVVWDTKIENLNMIAHLHEVLVHDVVTLCSNGGHTSFSADVAQISTIEALERTIYIRIGHWWKSC
jgi:hypothetical protein